ncbi:hypothetical protein FC093_00435 [Ilyomonas limi]|uniref:NAD glycohydrolase translocation F5/8 type C domain-containing protein n=1 Tax=Ilyomonas limi TaxID=2575867 RepID=A0A4U3L8D8_9BACT|nr:hypothetical protein [Ilyomonas limi]TKK71528.1 hypothetical protein FC093_00435 [Ilyomonas limi]
MKHIIRAIILMIILFFVAEHYQYAPNLMGIISVLFIIAFIYLIAGIIDVFRRRMIARKQVNTPVENIPKNNSGCSLLLLVIIAAAFVYYYRATVGSYSFKAILFVDNLVKLTDAISPLILWGILGLLIGAIYGSFVAWKKYKLHVTVNLIPIGIFILFVTILYKVNHPLDSVTFATARNLQTQYAYNLVTATAYNSLQDKNANYKPAFLLDNNDKTAWITNANAGTNADIRFSFSSLQDYTNKHLQCVGFAIKNGYRKSPQLWDSFARVKEVSIKHNGRLITSVILNDKNSDKEEIEIAPISISSFDNISISINTVYPGEKYTDRVAVTELVPIVQYDKF